jgi:hypothetical protein
MLRRAASDGVLLGGKEEEWRETMEKPKFIVKVNRGGSHAPEYVKRIDRTPIQTTTNHKLALLMGRFTAEDAVRSIQTSRCISEIVSVKLHA